MASDQCSLYLGLQYQYWFASFCFLVLIWFKSARMKKNPQLVQTWFHRMASDQGFLYPGPALMQEPNTNSGLPEQFCLLYWTAFIAKVQQPSSLTKSLKGTQLVQLWFWFCPDLDTRQNKYWLVKSYFNIPPETQLIPLWFYPDLDMGQNEHCQWKNCKTSAVISELKVAPKVNFWDHFYCLNWQN